MSFSAETAARRFPLFLFVALLLCPSPGNAEIDVEGRIGFHGVFQLGHPFPVEVELTNGGRPAEGILEVRVWKGGASRAGAPYALYTRKEVFLPAQSRRTVKFTVDPDFISRPLSITFTSEGGQGTQEIDLRRHFSPAPVVLLVNETNNAPPLLLSPGAQSRLVSLTLAELPSDSRALLGVSHLVLYEQSLREMSRSQLLALENWIVSGGRLVVLGSLNYALYQETNLGRFLPVRVTGLRRIHSLPVLTENGEPAPPGEIWAQSSTVVDGTVLKESEGNPLIVESSRGRGRITYVALDIGRPPLSHWRGLPALIHSLLSGGADASTPARTQWDDSVFSQLIASPSFISTYVPSGSLLAAIVAYLTAIAVLIWGWQKKRLSSRLFVAALSLVIIVSTATGYLLFSRGGNIPDGVLVSSTLLENISNGYVEAQSDVALFSTQVRNYDVHLQPGWLDLSPVTSRFRDRENAAVMNQDGSGEGRFQIPFREWDYRLFKARFVERLPVKVEFEQNGEKLLLKIDNPAAELGDCWLVVGGQAYSVGSVPANSQWRKQFPLPGSQPAEETRGLRNDAGFRDVTFKDRTRDILFHSSFFPRDDTNRWSSGAAVFVAWVKDPNRRVWVDDSRIWAYDYTLFRAVFPLAGDEDA
ncbi:MAG TPA: hypothetical protein VIB79_30165 [Candidatus Binatia bacterium]